MLVMSARSVATTEHFQQFMYKAWRWSIVQGAGGSSSFFLSSHEIKHWEFILQGVTVVFEGKHCGELHCVVAYKPTG